MSKKALFIAGGWGGHEPIETSKFIIQEINKLVICVIIIFLPMVNNMLNILYRRNNIQYPDYSKALIARLQTNTPQVRVVFILAKYIFIC